MCQDTAKTVAFFSETVSERCFELSMMVADGLVGSDSRVIAFLMAWLGHVTFLACCGISHAVFGLSL